MALTFILRAIANAAGTSHTKAAHAALITSATLPNLIASNNLITSYSKFGLMDHALKVFDQMPKRNTVTWACLISGYSKNGLPEAATHALRSMVAAGRAPNDFAYVSVLSACTSNVGKQIHGRIYRTEGGVSSSIVRSTLREMYARCGMVGAAQRVFDGKLKPGTELWKLVRSGVAENADVFRVFAMVREAGAEVDQHLLASVLGACTGLRDLKVGKQVHCYVLKSGIGMDMFVETAIVHMYVSCEDMEGAERAFFELDDPVIASWTALTKGYAQRGQVEKAMDLFKKLHSSGSIPIGEMFATVLVACSDAAAVVGGKQLHSLIIKSGDRNVTYTSNALVNFYSKCGLLGDSSRAFEETEDRDTVSWNTVISGHFENGDIIGATKLVKHMLLEGIAPDACTYPSILSLCGDVPALGWGQESHNHLIKQGFSDILIVGSALVEMYAKCGKLNYARKVFDRLSWKQKNTWNIMVVGYARYGLSFETIEMFSVMQRECITPNATTFIGVLSACAHAGLVELGKSYFDLMRNYRITPGVEHYLCMVDLFAGAGQTQMAYNLIEGMPFEPNKIIWRSLLAGCKKHKDLHLCKFAAKRILKMDPEDTDALQMLSGSYANPDLLDETTELGSATSS